MKMKYWLILAAALSAGVALEQVYADDQPGSSPGNTNTSGSPAPEKPKKKKLFGSKKTPTPAKKTATAASEPAKPAPVVAGPAVVSQPNVNVRGKAAINSEVITRLKRGDRVTVLALVEKKAKEDEPGKWAKVALPTNAAVWVNASFINAGDKTVMPKKLNLRSGPGENYSVVGDLPKGAAIKEIETKGDWMKIEPPASAYGFVAAHLLSSAPAASATPPPMVVAAIEPPKPPPTETVVAAPIVPVPAAEPVVPRANPPVAPPPAVTPPPVTPPPPAPPAETVATPTPAPAAPAQPVEEILVKRIVSREGVVKRTGSIQAPTYFALQSLDTGKMINYLYSPSTNVVLKDLMGKRILVTGEEVLDERWPNTPVINVDTLQAVP